MKLRKLLNQPAIFLIALVLALILRLIGLGKTMLTDYEAGFALQALNIMRGSHPLIGEQPAYVQLTSLLFFIFGPNSQIIARLWPAVFGSLIVFVPYGFRNRIGSIPAAILAFALAFDPGLLAISRQVGSPIIALACFWLGLSGLSSGFMGLAGILFGLAILGGPGFWPGLIGVTMGWLISRYLQDRSSSISSNDQGVDPVLPKPVIGLSRKVILYAIGTLLLVGSMLFTYPRGLSGLFDGLRSFLVGWVTLSDISPLTLLLALLAYHPLAIFLGVWGAIRGWRRQDEVDQVLSVITGITLFIFLVYPSRQIGDLGWVVVPLWALAARELSRHLAAERQEVIPAAGQAFLALVMAVFLWLNLTGMANSMGNGAAISLFGGFILGALMLTLLTSLLIAWGWSANVVRLGLVWGLSTALLLYLGSAASSAGGYRETFTSNLYLRDAAIPKANLLIESVNDFSRRHTGVVNNLDIQVVGVPSPALQWLLRDYPGAHFSDQLPAVAQPSLVITQKVKDPSMPASYRGEELTWYQSPDWNLMLPEDYVRWIVFQTSQASKTSLVLWVRNDIFPGGDVGIKPGITP